MQKIIEQIITETWKPLLVTVIEIFLIAVILWAITNFIPHTFLFLIGHNILTWAVGVTVIKLLLYKSNASEDIVNGINEPNTDNDDEDYVNELMMPFTETQTVPVPQKAPLDVKNVRSGLYPFAVDNTSDIEGTSTRE